MRSRVSFCARAGKAKERQVSRRTNETGCILNRDNDDGEQKFCGRQGSDVVDSARSPMTHDSNEGDETAHEKC